MQPPFPAYRGKEPYIFVSYAHADKAIVYPEIQLLNERGCRIWFDEGITPAHEWSEEIARAINGCGFFVVFMTPAAALSPYVNREIHWAVDRRKAFLVIYLEPTTLSDGLKWLIGPVQAITRHEIQHVTYLERLGRALPKETISARPLSSVDKVSKEKPVDPKTMIREESVKTAAVNDAAPPGAKDLSSTYDRSLSTPLLEAAKTGQSSAVRELLAKGAAQTPVQQAVRPR